jgi:hypothetical protein
LQIQGLYPKTRIDVEVSSDEDARLKPDALAHQKKASDGHDIEDGGVSSAEPIAPNLISSSAPEQSNPSATAQVTTTILLSGGHGCKRPPSATRRTKPLPQVDKVMS